MNQNNEHKVEETLRMAEHIQRVHPSAEFMDRLKAIPTSIREGYEIVPKKYIWLAAASIALLICLNFVSMRQYENTESTKSTSVAADYFSYVKTF